MKEKVLWYLLLECEKKMCASKYKWDGWSGDVYHYAHMTSLCTWLLADAYLHLKRRLFSRVNVFFFHLCWQVQIEPTSSWAVVRSNWSGTSKYTGMFQATKDIFREEGLAVRWLNSFLSMLDVFFCQFVLEIICFQFIMLIFVLCWFFALAIKN